MLFKTNNSILNIGYCNYNNYLITTGVNEKKLISYNEKEPQKISLVNSNLQIWFLNFNENNVEATLIKIFRTNKIYSLANQSN